MSKIDTRHQEKLNKYAHFLTDVSEYTTTVNCFEVSSTGYISTGNNATLQTLHKFIRPEIKKTEFLSTLNSLAWYGLYQIWLSREDPSFASPPYLIPYLHQLPPGRARATRPGQLGPQATSTSTRRCDLNPWTSAACQSKPLSGCFSEQLFVVLFA